MFDLNLLKNNKEYKKITKKKNKIYFYEEDKSIDLINKSKEIIKKINKKKLNHKMIKSEDNRTIYIIDFKKQNYYFKLFQENSFKDKIKKIYRSHAVRAFKKFLLLDKYNFNVPESFLAIENQSSSILITSEFGPNNMIELFKKKELTKKEIKKLFLKLAKETSNLYNHKMINSDPNLAGISVQKKNDKFSLANIDVDGIRRYLFLPQFMITYNLVKWNSLLLTHIQNDNLDQIDYNIRRIFLEEVYENIKAYKSISKADYLRTINKKTVDQLKEWGKNNIINNNPELNNISS